MKDKKLQLAFLILILLTVAIGVTGILEIQGLSRRVEDLGKRNLRLEKAVLEMRINNTIYSTEDSMFEIKYPAKDIKVLLRKKNV